MSVTTEAAPEAQRIQRAVSVIGAAEANLTVDLGEAPWDPWASPVMILAGAGPFGEPWLWLACRDCGWHLGYAAQYDPQALADCAASHRQTCPAAETEATP